MLIIINTLRYLKIVDDRQQQDKARTTRQENVCTLMHHYNSKTKHDLFRRKGRQTPYDSPPLMHITSLYIYIYQDKITNSHNIRIQ